MAYPIQPTFHDCGTVYHTDLLTLCGELARRGMRVDMILCDLPYGQTACAWDSVIPFDDMWTAFKRVIKPKGAIVLTASQPFTSALVMSNPKMFRYEWIYEKSKSTTFLDSKTKPLKKHENVLVFGNPDIQYFPQMVHGEFHKRGRKKQINTSHVYGTYGNVLTTSNEYYPNSLLFFSSSTVDQLHPTQKPVDLFRYLIRTYTRPGELVFDGTCGSGTTAIAAREEGRRFIVGDSSAEYVDVTRRRLDAPYTPSFMPTLEQAG